MSPQQKKRIQETWCQIVPMADQAATLFYGRWFAIDPSLRALFADVDMASQRTKLVQGLSTVVGGLDRVEDLVPTLEDLGRRHAGYGVKDAHYETVGTALLWTLEQGLGESWTAETEAAWTAAYTHVAGVMRGAAANTPSDRQGASVAA